MVLARYTELGRIRIGDLAEIEKGNNKGKPRANKLNIFRITSNHLKILEQISGLYGGDVHEWVRPEKWKNLPYVKEPTHDFELYTTSNILDVIVPTGASVSTVREVWDARGCAHRCLPDSREITLDDDESVIGEPCTREDCVEVARFAVMLSKIHAMGLWRLDTKGFYGASEIRGFFDIMNMCRLPLGMEATLSLEERQRKSHKKGTLNFVVPVLQPLLTPGELLQLSAAAQVPMLMGPPPTIEEAQGLIAEVHGERSPAPQYYTPEKRAEPVKVLEGVAVKLWEDSPEGQESKKHPLMDGADEAERATRPSVATILTAPEPEEAPEKRPHEEGLGLTSKKLAEDSGGPLAVTPPIKSVEKIREEAGALVNAAAAACRATPGDIWDSVKTLAPKKFQLQRQQDLDTVESLLPSAVELWVKAQPEAELLAWLDAEAGRRGVEPVALKGILTEYSEGWEGTLATLSAVQVAPWKIWAVGRFDKYGARGKAEAETPAPETELTTAL